MKNYKPIRNYEKNFIYSLFLTFLNTVPFAQEDDKGNGEKVRERMTEYIQKRLNLSKSEAERFSPAFRGYFNELRKTNQLYKGDRLVHQQKIADLRLRYRDQFKPIMGDKRSNDVFMHERKFVDEVKRLRHERMQKRGAVRPNKRIKGQLQ